MTAVPRCTPHRRTICAAVFLCRRAASVTTCCLRTDSSSVAMPREKYDRAPSGENPVTIGEAQIAQTALDRRPDMLATMIVVPQLGSDPKILPTTVARLQRRSDTVADFLFVSIVAGTIEMPIARANCLLHDLRHGWLV